MSSFPRNQSKTIHRWVTQIMLIVLAVFTFSSANQVEAFFIQHHLDRNGFAIKKSLVSKFSPLVHHTVLQQLTLSESWLPSELLAEATDLDTESWTREVESKAVSLMAELIREKLQAQNEGDVSSTEIESTSYLSTVRGKFVDLCCTVEGEKNLESLFNSGSVDEHDQPVILGAIASLHSLLITGMSYGLSGTPEQFDRWLSHLAESGDDDESIHDYKNWSADSTRRLKFCSDRSAGTQLLAELKWKQSAQGAFDLLVAIGAWSKHEDLALLRSGFPIRFSKSEVDAARDILNSLRKDPEDLLGIRSDLRKMKVVTIDSASTSEIDDGISCESYTAEDGTQRLRYWVHIADADHWAPRDSIPFLGAKKRATSHYLPQMSISMFPPELSDEMSLTAQKDSMALSLGVELSEDGSIIDSSIIVTPSIVRVSYRLTYDDVDDMLGDGIGYREEWELGALYSAAIKRRDYRIRNGSSEGFVPKQIPQCIISVFGDRREPDGVGMNMKIDISHNGGVNQSSIVGDLPSQQSDPVFGDPVSSASVLVTEMMIMAGEAIGKWKLCLDREVEESTINSTPLGRRRNVLRLAFRSQPKPDFRSRAREKRIMDDLLLNSIGDGYCHAWYARRFLSPVVVSEIPNPHAGLGLECYSQWSSPIRRFGDLQVHCAIKRFLRRRAVLQLYDKGQEVPAGITALDLGLDVLRPDENIKEFLTTAYAFDESIDYSDRAGWLRAAKTMQKNSQRYWILEYIRRMKEKEPEKTFEVLVLGCTNPSRRQYALYVYELGLEWRYISPGTSLQAGMKFKMQVGNVLPRLGQLTLVRVEL